MDSRINTMYLTEQNSRLPLLFYPRPKQDMNIDVYIQYINLLLPENTFELSAFDQDGKVILEPSKIAVNLDDIRWNGLFDSRRTVGEVSFFISATKEELKSVNRLDVHVRINDEIEGFVSLFLTEANNG